MPSLSPQQWKQVTDLFHRALELSAESRPAFLAAETRGDDVLLREIESLLACADEADEFLEEPAVPKFFDGAAPPALVEGAQFGDFTILRVLGAGSFATVYLAHQLSLNRKVALKVSRNVGEEARNMAHLEHDNIVKVFSETVDPAKNLRLLCMQFVPGTSLENIFADVAKRRPGTVTGTTLLEIIDNAQQQESTFNPEALKDRERLANFDGIEAAIWMGIRLADALAYAHERGVLHLDVKPGNILVSPYGRPMLTDFNVSIDRATLGEKTPKMVGGTAQYMPPEQQALFQTKDMDGTLRAIDHRADLYSLAVVIREMVTRFSAGRSDSETLPELAQILRRCTEPVPAKRYASAAELSKALEGCLELRDIGKSLPAPGVITRFTQAFPWLATISFTVAPQVLGSVINISYNSMRIVSELTPAQKSEFLNLCVIYNAVLYPICVWIFYRQVRPVIRFLKRPRGARCERPEALAPLRRHVLRLPLWIVLATTLGWMPGSIFFPLAIHLKHGPLAPAVFGHFFISFTLSWLIALAYSFLYVQFTAVRVIYPQLCMGNAGIRRKSRAELAVLGPAMRLIHFTAGFVPLIGAALVVYVGPEQLDPSHYNTYRLLVTLLIASGMVGLVFAIRATGILAQTMYALTGSDKPVPGSVR